MLEGLIEKTSNNIEAIRLIIKTNDSLRMIILSQTHGSSNDQNNNSLNRLIDLAPPSTEWKIYDHCSVITRLYAIYETFVEDLIKDWLVILPEVCSSYFDLEECIQKTHRDGVGHLLLKKDYKKYQHLTVNQVIKGLFHGISSNEDTNNERYELLADAFLIYEQNLRKDSLEKLFKGSGIQNSWQWINNHRDVKKYIQEVRGNENTAEKELEQFIEYRNEAAHGTPVDQLLGSNNLLDLCFFIEALCKALAELVNYQVLQKKYLIGEVNKIGIITEWLPRPQAAIAKIIRESTFSIGDSIYLVSQSRSQCKLAKIESIQIDDIPQQTVIYEGENKEVGLKFDIDTIKDVELYLPA